MSHEFKEIVDNLLARIDSITPDAKNSEDIMLLATTLERLHSISEGGNLNNELLSMVIDLQTKIALIESEHKHAIAAINDSICSNKVLIDSNTDRISSNADAISANNQTIISHISKDDNSHKITKAQLGLENVPNYSATSDVEDASENKFATAKGVNTIWKSIPSLPALHEIEATIQTITDKINNLEEELLNFDLINDGVILGPLKVYGDISASNDIIAFDESIGYPASKEKKRISSKKVEEIEKSVKKEKE